MEAKGTIYSIGHSNHPPERFFDLVRQAGIRGIVDVRSIPASSRFPHFSKKKLQRICQVWDVAYVWLGELGGKGRGLQENLTTSPGQQQFQQLIQLVTKEETSNATGARKRWAVMCSEHDWRQCHRKELSDELVAMGFEVVHISALGEQEKHIITK
eukprot:TRINITY_DN4312_c0_g1_i10.p2 TRINITY_DN4312_c0_g1~~TRINITY_DN4312_c0_g1_i10.p2  ORF type:complete len:156 (+),score=19.53 TRINITY_DN4312_c0_g1_i10:127-594(+)